MGTMNLVPTLGKRFYMLVPFGLVLVCLAVGLRVHNRLMRWLKLSNVYQFDDAFGGSRESSQHSLPGGGESTEQLLEGRELIHYARRMEERLYHRSADAFYTASRVRMVQVIDA